MWVFLLLFACAEEEKGKGKNDAAGDYVRPEGTCPPGRLLWMGWEHRSEAGYLQPGVVLKATPGVRFVTNQESDGTIGSWAFNEDGRLVEWSEETTLADLGEVRVTDMHIWEDGLVRTTLQTRADGVELYHDFIYDLGLRSTALVDASGGQTMTNNFVWQDGCMTALGMDINEMGIPSSSEHFACDEEGRVIATGPGTAATWNNSDYEPQNPYIYVSDRSDPVRLEEPDGDLLTSWEWDTSGSLLSSEAPCGLDKSASAHAYDRNGTLGASTIARCTDGEVQAPVEIYWEVTECW